MALVVAEPVAAAGVAVFTAPVQWRPVQWRFAEDTRERRGEKGHACTIGKGRSRRKRRIEMYRT